MSKGIQKSSFGHLLDGTEIDIYTLTNANGLSCKIMTYGGIITEIRTPDRNGKFANIVLGYDRLEDYLEGKDYRGAIIGRVANRIRNAEFKLGGKTYKLAANDGPNHLHGGIRGFDKRVWVADPDLAGEDVTLNLEYTSPDKEEGYPGTLKVRITYFLTDLNELTTIYFASTDQPTPVNLTNHPYWNLAGHGDILQHELTISADEHTPMDSQFIPTGEFEWVEGTDFDFRTPTRIGRRMTSGYNANYLIKGKEGVAFAARARDPDSGRVLKLFSSQLGLQFYTGAYLKQPFTGFCLEAQSYPNSVNQGNFPPCILSPGEFYNHSTTCAFSTQ